MQKDLFETIDHTIDDKGIIHVFEEGEEVARMFLNGNYVWYSTYEQLWKLTKIKHEYYQRKKPTSAGGL